MVSFRFRNFYNRYFSIKNYIDRDKLILSYIDVPSSTEKFASKDTEDFITNIDNKIGMLLFIKLSLMN